MYIHDDGTAYSMTDFCPAAIRFTGKKEKCCNCPFKKCICDIHPAKLKILNYAQKAIKAYDLISSGMSDNEIIEILGINLRQMHYWKSNWNIIQSKINDLITI